jgi:hypothetical protein
MLSIEAVDLYSSERNEMSEENKSKLSAISVEAAIMNGWDVEGSTQSGERNWQKWVLASQRRLRVLKTGLHV